MKSPELTDYVKPGWHGVLLPECRAIYLEGEILQYCREQFGWGYGTNLYQGQDWEYLGRLLGQPLFQFEKPEHAMWFRLRWL